MRDLAVTKEGSSWYLCAVGATEHGAKVFLLDHFDTVGFDRYDEETHFGPGVQDDLVSVDVVGSNLAILSRHYAIAARLHDLSNSAVNPSTSGEGPPRDTLLMKEGTTSFSKTMLWSMTAGTGADYRFKIRDVATLLPGTPLVTETYYGPGGTDTAVYVPELDSVYASTFHGVVRYDVSFPPSAVPDYGSYSVALDSESTPPRVLPIEHMIGAKREPAWDVYTWQLFANAAVGGFFQWGLHPVTRQPHLIDFVDGVAAGAWPDWSQFTPGAGPAPYGQDVEYGIDPHTGHEILVMDHYDHESGQVAINFYDLTADAWSQHLLGPQDPAGLPMPRATPWDVTLSDEWVLVACERGFFAAEIVAAPSQPTSKLELRGHALTYDATHPAGPVGPPGGAGWSFQEVRGIQRVGDRLFVSMADQGAPPQNRFALAMYAFDTTTGAIGATPLAVRLDGANGQPDDFVALPGDPQIFLAGGGRLRAFTHGDVTQLFCCTQNGYVLQVDYDHVSDALESAPYRFWHNGAYFNETNDCQIVNLAAPGFPPDLRLTVTKWTETFAIVQPFGF